MPVIKNLPDQYPLLCICNSLRPWQCILNWVNIVGWGNGLLPVRHHAIGWTNADLSSETNFGKICINIQSFSVWKISSAKCQPFLFRPWLCNKQEEEVMKCNNHDGCGVRNCQKYYPDSIHIHFRLRCCQCPILWGLHSMGDINWNLAKTPIAPILLVMMKSGYNFVHATTAQLSWHVQNHKLIW